MSQSDTVGDQEVAGLIPTGLVNILLQGLHCLLRHAYPNSFGYYGMKFSETDGIVNHISISDTLKISHQPFGAKVIHVLLILFYTEWIHLQEKECLTWKY